MAERTLERVVVAGGTGLVGRPLVQALVDLGAQVTVLTRRPAGLALPAGATARTWEEATAAMEGADAVINLAGEGIADRRWTPSRKAALLESRTHTTRRLVDALEACTRRPRALVNASATGYYAPRGPEPVDEASAPGEGFLAEVCRAWEAEALAATAFGLRVAVVRIGVVLAREGGALPKMALPVNLFQGCRLGDGTQGLSWIHLDDLVVLLVEAARNPAWEGAFNGTAPEPLSNEAFTRAIARRLHRPLLPVPAFLTRTVLTLALGEVAEALLLQGVFVHPRRVLERGFQFRFPTAAAALADLL